MNTKSLLLCQLLLGFLGMGHALGATVYDLAARMYSDQYGDLFYRLFIPSNYVATTKYPLVIFLHGSGERGSDNVNQLSVHPDPLVFVSTANQASHPSFLVAPQCPSGLSWNAAQLMGLLRQLADEFNVDPDRLYVTGLSMGGFGSWDLITTYPNTFAAAIPMSAYASRPLPAPFKLPVWIFQGAVDNSVDVSGARNTVAAVRNGGGTIIYTEYSNGPHEVWTAAYNTPPLVDWTMAQRRGQPATTLPRVDIASQPLSPTGASSIPLSGSAANASNSPVYEVSWTNSLGGSGLVAGTGSWQINSLPLQVGTNVLAIVARGTNWTTTFGGFTTFNGAVTVVREPSIVLKVTAEGADVVVSWSGGVPPFQVETATNPALGGWTAVLTNSARVASFPLNETQTYYRVSGK